MLGILFVSTLLLGVDAWKHDVKYICCMDISAVLFLSLIFFFVPDRKRRDKRKEVSKTKTSKISLRQICYSPNASKNLIKNIAPRI